MLPATVERTLTDRYRLIHRIGGGGMGAVFEAEDMVLRRHVAVKLLPGVGAGDRGFLREARALSRLRHPGIVGLYDAGDDAGDAYLVLELVRGRTLRDVLADGPVTPEHAVEIGRQLAEALAHAHHSGVVHRDLSPGNVLVDEEGRVRLADFGIARMSEATATLAAEVWGTPAYMAPEQVAGDPVGPSADVYALGLILLEALTGQRAFPGAPREAGFARLHRDPDVPADLPGAWAPLLRAMTGRRPADRPAAASVATRLGASPTAVLPPPPPPPAVTMPDPVRTRPLSPAAPVAFLARRRSYATVTGLLVTAALLVGLAARSDDGKAADPAVTVSPVADVPPATQSPPPSEPVEEDDDADDDDSRGDGKGSAEGKGKGKRDD